MDAHRSPDYTPQEIRSYLPGGWNLVDEAEDGTWDPRRGVWAVPVRDTTDLEWSLRVTAKDLETLGRLAALRSAAERLHLRR